MLTGFGGTRNPVMRADLAVAPTPPSPLLSTRCPVSPLCQLLGYNDLDYCLPCYTSLLAPAGLVVARTPGGDWSAPCAVSAAGMGWGLQLGGELADVLLVRAAALLPDAQEAA